MSHSFDLRVYYEDTDLAGIVYYANYLKFIERGRTEFIRTLGVDQADLRARLGLVFAVRQLTADYLLPARFDDQLQVQTRLTSQSGAKITLAQDVLRGGECLFCAQVTLVCLNDLGKPARIPADIRQKLAEIAQPLAG